MLQRGFYINSVRSFQEDDWRDKRHQKTLSAVHFLLCFGLFSKSETHADWIKMQKREDLLLFHQTGADRDTEWNS